MFLRPMAMVFFSSSQSRLPPPRRAGGRNWRLLLLVWLGLLSLAAHAQRLTLRLDLRTGGPAADPTFVYFEQGATTDFDADYDASKLPNPNGLNLASCAASGRQLAVNGLPATLLSASFTLNLFVGVPDYSAYTLRVSQLDNFASTSVYLVDNLLSTSLALAPDTTYAFEITADNTNGTYATSMRFAL